MSRMSGKRALLVLLATVFVAVGCDASSGDDIECARDSVALEEGLRVRDLVCGSGTVADPGMTLTVLYETRLEDGTSISQPRANGRYSFRLGAGQVVAGWDEGLPGMAVGGTRELIVPPELAYGSAGLYPDIPPGATVTFEVELLEAKDPESS